MFDTGLRGKKDIRAKSNAKSFYERMKPGKNFRNIAKLENPRWCRNSRRRQKLAVGRVFKQA